MAQTQKDLRKFQQAVNRIQNHPKYEDTLEELDTNQASRTEAVADAKGFLKRKGLPIPDGMNVTFTEGSGSLRFCIFGVCFSVEWP